MKKGSKKINKKLIIIVLVSMAVVCAVAAVIVHFATRLTNESYANCSLGDVNGDGVINSVDALLIVDGLEDEKLLFENQKKLADVNADGIMNSADALILQRYIAGEIKQIPYDEKAEYKGNGGKSAKTEKDGLKLELEIVNKWSNGDGTYSYQFDCKLNNTSNSYIGEWHASVKLNAKAKTKKKWDCNCKVNSGVITLDGDSIYAGEEATCGFILTSKSDILIESAQINN